MTPELHVVMYHYIRDLPHTRFPRIKGMLTQDFCQQLVALQRRYEMATLESAIDFIRGDYIPARDLCLLTFDDGLKEHYAEVTPLLTDRGLQGVFFVITSCLNGKYVAPVHMNHFLMAALEFDTYRTAFLEALAARFDLKSIIEANPEIARRTYRWDSPDVASFKYLCNFLLDCSIRDQVLEELFEEHIGEVESFGSSLYVSAKEAKRMQSVGMIIGGHSHQHKPLSSLSDKELELDLQSCRTLLTDNLYPQALWPFCYPYGKKDSFNENASKQLKRLGFICSFSTEVGSNASCVDLFALKRHDCKDPIFH